MAAVPASVRAFATGRLLRRCQSTGCVPFQSSVIYAGCLRYLLQISKMDR